MLLIFPLATYSQSITLFNIDTTDFPTMKANFYVFDDNSNLLNNFSLIDFEIKENEKSRDVLSVTCPEISKKRLSIVIAVDVTIFNNIDNAKTVLAAWIEAIPLGTDEVAIISYDGDSYINQDFTTNKTKLLTAVSSPKKL